MPLQGRNREFPFEFMRLDEQNGLLAFRDDGEFCRLVWNHPGRDGGKIDPYRRPMAWLTGDLDLPTVLLHHSID